MLLGGLAQFYSDNLSQETQKGWAERRAQGLCCGLLLFGAMKGEDGVPVPHPDSYPGLMMAFQLAAEGKSDKEVAIALNAAGYRTAGNQRQGLFSKDTLRGRLTNRFYLGYLPDGNGGWVKGKHKAIIDEELWSEVQEARRRNATSTHSRCVRRRRVCSLTGITYCWYCKGGIHVSFTKMGKPRLGCYNRSKGWGCPQRSALLEVYEEQIKEYLKTFHIPEDYQLKILEAHRKLEGAYHNLDRERARWEAQLERMKDLYRWGDMSKEVYLKERQAVLKKLNALAPAQSQTQNLERLAHFLANVADAWKEATQEQRNKLGLYHTK